MWSLARDWRDIRVEGGMNKGKNSGKGYQTLWRQCRNSGWRGMRARGNMDACVGPRKMGRVKKD